jgi:hypothetical protein
MNVQTARRLVQQMAATLHEIDEAHGVPGPVSEWDRGGILNVARELGIAHRVDEALRTWPHLSMEYALFAKARSKGLDESERAS